MTIERRKAQLNQLVPEERALVEAVIRANRAAAVVRAQKTDGGGPMPQHKEGKQDMTENETDWEEWVDEGKRLATVDRGGAAFALGDLALAVEPVGKEGIKTGALDRLAEYAAAIDVPFGTLRQYRAAAAAWPSENRFSDATFKAHYLLMGEEDRTDLIRDGYRSPTAIAALLAERHPKVAPKRDERWWHAEREAARLLRQFDVKRMLAGWSNADKRRAVALIREHIQQEEEVARQIERKAETHRL